MKEKYFGDIDKYLQFMFGPSDPSGDVEWLLAPGRVEELVREGRSPLQIGSIGKTGPVGNGEKVSMYPLYEVPPPGFNIADIERVYSSMGTYVFVNRLGFERIGASFTLTEGQSKELKNRVEAELKKLGK